MGEQQGNSGIGIWIIVGLVLLGLYLTTRPGRQAQQQKHLQQMYYPPGMLGQGGGNFSFYLGLILGVVLSTAIYYVFGIGMFEALIALAERIAT